MLNRDKCQFKMSHLVFMCHVLSARGIGPVDVKAVVNRELKQTTTTKATRTSPNKRFNEQNNSCARAL